MMRHSAPLNLAVATAACCGLLSAAAEAALVPAANGPVAYVSDAGIGNDDIYLSYGLSALPVRLTDDPALDRQPAISPDGTRIAFYSTRNTAEFPNPEGDSELYVMDITGDDVHRLTDNDDRDFAPAWSPNGKRVVFATDRDGNNEIYLMRIDRTATKRLTDDPASDQFPVFSPDGSLIAFQRALGTNQEIFTLAREDDPVTGRAEGSLENLTQNPMLDALPDFSPDGTKITFSSNRGGGGDIDVWTMNLDRSDATNLTDALRTTNDRWSSWSPQGDQIAFWSGAGTGTGTDAEIRTVTLNDGSLLNLTANTFGDIEPDW